MRGRPSRRPPPVNEPVCAGLDVGNLCSRLCWGSVGPRARTARTLQSRARPPCWALRPFFRFDREGTQATTRTPAPALIRLPLCAAHTRVLSLRGLAPACQITGLPQPDPSNLTGMPPLLPQCNDRVNISRRRRQRISLVPQATSSQQPPASTRCVHASIPH